MKNTWIASLFLLVAVTVSAETVSEVSFNPARLGNFKKLKVSDSATIRGGLQVSDELKIGGQETEGCDPEYSAGRPGTCRVEIGSDVVVTSSLPYTASSITAALAAPGFAETRAAVEEPDEFRAYRVDMPQATFHGGSVPAWPYTMPRIDAGPTSNWPDGTLLPVTVNGGYLSFGNDSLINNLQLSTKLMAYARETVVHGRLNVAGNELARLYDPSSLPEDNITGFKLGNVVIPPPTSGKVEYYSSAASTPSDTGLNYNDSGCRLDWIKQKVNRGESEVPEAVYVLGFKDCNPTCVETDWEMEFETEPCPSGRGQKWANKRTRNRCVEGVPTQEIDYKKSDGEWGGTEPYWHMEDCNSGCRWRPTGYVKPNDYVSHWMYRNKRYTGPLGHEYKGLQDDTECTLLRIGNGINPSIIPGVGIIISTWMQRTNAISTEPERTHVNELLVQGHRYNTSDTGIDIILGLSSDPDYHLLEAGIRECNADSNGAKEWVRTYAVVPAVFGFWPVMCQGVANQVEVECRC